MPRHTSISTPASSLADSDASMSSALAASRHHARACSTSCIVHGFALPRPDGAARSPRHPRPLTTEPMAPCLRPEVYVSRHPLSRARGVHAFYCNGGLRPLHQGQESLWPGSLSRPARARLWRHCLGPVAVSPLTPLDPSRCAAGVAVQAGEAAKASELDEADKGRQWIARPQQLNLPWRSEQQPD